MATIRSARVEDVKAIVELGYMAREASPVYRVHPVSEPKFRGILAKMIASKRHYVGVIDKSGEPVGVLMGYVAELPFSTQKQAADWMFYVKDGSKGYAPILIKDFLAWAWEQAGVVMVGLTNSSGAHMERTEALYSKMGLHRIGGIWLDRYIKE